MSRTIFTFNCGMKSDRYRDDDVVVCRGVAGINSDGNSKLARIYLRSAWRNSSRSKYDRPASILIRSGGLRASEKFPVETDHAWVAAVPKRIAEAFASHISACILVSSANFFLSAKYGLRIISMFDLA